MKSKRYIKDGLRKLVKRYPQLTFFYQFDEIENLHMVQVEPRDEFESNIAYQIDEADLTFDFDNSFFPESIVFISSDSLICVDSPEFILNSFLLNLGDQNSPKYNIEGMNNEYISGENSYALAA